MQIYEQLLEVLEGERERSFPRRKSRIWCSSASARTAAASSHPTTATTEEIRGFRSTSTSSSGSEGASTGTLVRTTPTAGALFGNLQEKARSRSWASGAMGV